MTENYYVPDYDKIDGHFYKFIQKNADIDHSSELAFHYLEIEQSQQISNEVLNFIKTQTTVLDRAEFWNFINLDKMCHSCPTLLKFLKINKLRPIVSVCIHVNKDKNNNVIHMDGGDDSVKKNPRLLFPISNCEHSLTKFYKLKVDRIDQNTIDSGVIYYGVNGEDAEFTQACKLDKPILFNPRYPHAVCMEDGSLSPRLSLTFFFMNIPIFITLDRAKSILDKIKTLDNINMDIIKDLEDNISKLDKQLQINTLDTSIIRQAYEKETLEITTPVFLNDDTINYIKENNLSPLCFLED